MFNDRLMELIASGAGLAWDIITAMRSHDSGGEVEKMRTTAVIRQWALKNPAHFSEGYGSTNEPMGSFRPACSSLSPDELKAAIIKMSSGPYTNHFDDHLMAAAHAICKIEHWK